MLGLCQGPGDHLHRPGLPRVVLPHPAMGLNDEEGVRPGTSVDQHSTLPANQKPGAAPGSHVVSSVTAAPSIFSNPSNMAQGVIIILLLVSHCAVSLPGRTDKPQFEAYHCDAKEVAVLKGPRHHQCWQKQKQQGGEPEVSTRGFAGLQEKSTVGHSGWRCEGKRSFFSGHCGK